MASTFVSRGSSAALKILSVASLAAVTVPHFCYTVAPGYSALIFDRFQGGLQNEVHGPGLHFNVPWVQEPRFFDTRITPTEIPTMTGAKDLQQVSITLRLLSRPNIALLPQTISQIGVDYNERILPSISNEVLKAVVAQFNAEQLITQREAISREIRESLSTRAESFGIVLHDVSIVHVGFSPDFAKAIEDKQVAEQSAERAKYVVDRADQERQAVVIRAEGDATAAKLVSDAIGRAGTGLIELRRIETALAVAAALADKPNVTYLPGDANPLLMLPQPTKQHSSPAPSPQSQAKASV